MYSQLDVVSVEIVEALLQALQDYSWGAHSKLSELTQKPDVLDFRFYLDNIRILIELGKLCL
jgi:hypothetical protein